jgi:hypothetical protein
MQTTWNYGTYTNLLPGFCSFRWNGLPPRCLKNCPTDQFCCWRKRKKTMPRMRQANRGSEKDTLNIQLRSSGGFGHGASVASPERLRRHSALTVSIATPRSPLRHCCAICGRRLCPYLGKKTRPWRGGACALGLFSKPARTLQGVQPKNTSNAKKSCTYSSITQAMHCVGADPQSRGCRGSSGRRNTPNRD